MTCSPAANLVCPQTKLLFVVIFSVFPPIFPVCFLFFLFTSWTFIFFFFFFSVFLRYVHSYLQLNNPLQLKSFLIIQWETKMKLRHALKVCVCIIVHFRLYLWISFFLAQDKHKVYSVPWHELVCCLLLVGVSSCCIMAQLQHTPVSET